MTNVSDKIKTPVLYSITFSPLQITSFSTTKSGGRVATFPPQDRLDILRHFLQSRWNGYTAVKRPSKPRLWQQVAPRTGDPISVGQVIYRSTDALHCHT